MNITIPETIQAALDRSSPVAIGVSGGKDSCAVAIAVAEHLQGYRGPVVLIHSDLGLVEWKDSLPTCERLAKHLGLDLIVVRRQAGGMMERWEQRWENNVERYINLECVKLILPWSTPSMRFCTSELKSAVIASDLKKRFGGSTVPILSVTGIRADESKSRAKQPLFKANPRLIRAGDGTNGFDWHPIHHWKTPEVYTYLQEKQFELHEAYKVFGSTRVSCAFCIMSSENDKKAAASCEDNREIYIRMVDLEIYSSFSFQDGKWLADVAPQLLSKRRQHLLEYAKYQAKAREDEEARIPKELEYEKGWPLFVPDLAQAEIIADVRRSVRRIMKLDVRYLTAEAVQGRYQELINERNEK